jgi:hypothetical protein
MACQRGRSAGSDGVPRRSRTARRNMASSKIAIPKGRWIAVSVRNLGCSVETIPMPINSIARTMAANNQCNVRCSGVKYSPAVLTVRPSKPARSSDSRQSPRYADRTTSRRRRSALRGAGRRRPRDKVPRERPLSEALLNILREKIWTELRQRRMIDEMLRHCVLHGPAHKLSLSIGIDQSERVQTVVCLVSPAVCPGCGLCPFGKGLSFGMCREEVLGCSGIWFSSCRINILRQCQLIEGLRRGDDEHRRIIHAASPFLSVRRDNTYCHAANTAGGVCRIGIASCDGEPADDRITSGYKHWCGRKSRSSAIRLERASEAGTFRMIAPA